MELRQLRYFCAIAARNSFRGAAEDVHVAQPALSQQVRQLEVELGVELFDRRSRPVRLTDAGAHLLPRARQILADIERTGAEVREFGGEFRGRIIVGAMQYLTTLEFPDLLTSFRERHPMVEVQLRMGNTDQVRRLLEDGDIDIAFCHADGLHLPAEYRIEELRVEELVIIVATRNNLAGLRDVTVRELADVPFITFHPGASIDDALQDAFARQGITPQASFQSADMATTFALVRRDLGVALVPRSMAETDRVGVSAIALRPARITRQVAMIRRVDRYRSRAVDAFAEHAKRSIVP